MNGRILPPIPEPNDGEAWAELDVSLGCDTGRAMALAGLGLLIGFVVGVLVG
jgi:hypothetical protein